MRRQIAPARRHIRRRSAAWPLVAAPDARRASRTRSRSRPSLGLQPAQLDVPLRGLEALEDQLRGEMRQALELLHRARGANAAVRAAAASIPPQAHPSPLSGGGRRLHPRFTGGRFAGTMSADICWYRSADVDRVRVAPSQLLDAIGQQVESAEQQIERAAVEQPRLLLRRDEQLFQLVGKMRDVDEAQHARRALQTVALAEYFRQRARSVSACQCQAPARGGASALSPFRRSRASSTNLPMNR